MTSYIIESVECWFFQDEIEKSFYLKGMAMKGKRMQGFGDKSHFRERKERLTALQLKNAKCFVLSLGDVLARRWNSLH